MKKKMLTWAESQPTNESNESSITIMDYDSVSESSIPIYRMPINASDDGPIFEPS
jgi:hypothetical protein